jgi:hypothetical protein
MARTVKTRPPRSRRTTPLLMLVLALATASLVAAAPANAATRDIRVHVTNSSDEALTRASWTLDHGCWPAGVEPPLTIAVDQTVDIASESCGVATGTEFTVTYWVGSSGQQLSLHYNNPFVGSDDFNESAPPGYTVQSSGVIEDRTARFACDSPCDGIPLDWKQNGVTIDPGGGNPPQFVDLPAMGLSLDRPNVLVHLDWMADATNNQQLRQAAIDAVINAYDQDPVTHRGATRPGITLIVDAGSNSTIRPGGPAWGLLSQARSIPWTRYLLTGNSGAGYQEANLYTLLNSRFVPTGRLPIFHYAVAGAWLSQDTRPTPAVDDTTSGMTPGNQLGFIVTLGGWTGGTGSQAEQTGTFMHELGHTLGFDHSGGDGNADAVNYKPNYPSIMNYAYQTRGVFRGGAPVFDYSRDTTLNLSESSLTESGGINLGSNPSSYGTTYSCLTTDAAGNTTRTVFTQAALSPVDWSCDTITPNGGTGFDANGSGGQGTLNGSTSDWSRLVFKTGGVGKGQNAKDTVTIPSSGVSAPRAELTFEQARLIRSLPLDTTLTYNGATTGHYHDLATMSATLLDPGAGDAPVAGKTISFRIGLSAVDVCSAVTDSAGTASCSIRMSQAPAAHMIHASYPGSTIHKAASDSSQTFTITREETSLIFTGPTVILAGSSIANLSATLVEGGENSHDSEGSFPPSPFGQTVTFTLGLQSCSGVTDASGAASCSIAGVSGSTLGPKTLTVTFGGDTYYQPSSKSAPVIVFAFPSRGAFVLGDATVASATTNTTVTWWGDSWGQNSLSGGSAPSSFKGFAADVTSLPTKSPADVCGSTFLTRAGNSPPPTEDVPAYMGVVVASSVAKNGSNVNGVWGTIVVVKTGPGYAPGPGHEGTGTVVATFCS